MKSKNSKGVYSILYRSILNFDVKKSNKNLPLLQGAYKLLGVRELKVESYWNICYCAVRIGKTPGLPFDCTGINLYFDIQRTKIKIGKFRLHSF